MTDIYSLAELGMGIIALVFGGKFTRDVLIARAKARPKAELISATATKNSIQRFGSAYELLQSMQAGLDEQAKQISAACQEKHVDPMQDVGYQTVVNNYQKVSTAIEKYQSTTVLGFPIAPLIDEMFWPIAKKMPDTIMKFAKGIM